MDNAVLQLCFAWTDGYLALLPCQQIITLSHSTEQGQTLQATHAFVYGSSPLASRQELLLLVPAWCFVSCL